VAVPSEQHAFETRDPKAERVRALLVNRPCSADQCLVGVQACIKEVACRYQDRRRSTPARNTTNGVWERACTVTPLDRLDRDAAGLGGLFVGQKVVQLASRDVV
jgi:hypothetical protein